MSTFQLTPTPHITSSHSIARLPSKQLTFNRTALSVRWQTLHGVNRFGGATICVSKSCRRVRCFPVRQVRLCCNMCKQIADTSSAFAPSLDTDACKVTGSRSMFKELTKTFDKSCRPVDWFVARSCACPVRSARFHNKKRMAETICWFASRRDRCGELSHSISVVTHDRVAFACALLKTAVVENFDIAARVFDQPALVQCFRTQ